MAAKIAAMAAFRDALQVPEQQTGSACGSLDGYECFTHTISRRLRCIIARFVKMYLAPMASPVLWIAIHYRLERSIKDRQDGSLSNTVDYDLSLSRPPL